MKTISKSRIILAGVILILIVLPTLSACASLNAEGNPSPVPSSATGTAPAAPVRPAASLRPVLEPQNPRYGGVFTMVLDAEQPNYDHATLVTSRVSSQTANTLLEGDWTKGPAGENIADFWNSTAPLELNTGALAESWEIIGDDTIVYHIRQGVRYGLNLDNEASRLVGGRELTAYDFAFSSRRQFDMEPSVPTPRGIGLSRLTPEEQPLSIEAPDKSTVVIKGQPGYLGSLFYWTGLMTWVTPPEVAKKYGNLAEALNNVGTGAFMISDRVPGSSLTFIRNPNYWEKDPVGPGKGNQLPYVERTKFLIVPDLSTRLAAFRTGKVDFFLGVSRDDYQSLIKDNPSLKTVKMVTGGNGLAMRVDRPEQPWYDKRVRQALQMGLDRQAIVRDYYGGEAEIQSYPGYKTPMFDTLGVNPAFDSYPASVKALFEYNPEKARRLLAEAGYPQGFKMEVILQRSQADEASIMKDQLAKIGVILELVPKENSVYTSIGTGRTHKEGIYTPVSNSAPQAWHQLRPTDTSNRSMVDDPVVNEAIAKFAKYFMIEDEKAWPIIGEITPYVLEQAWYLEFPIPYNRTVWWPWVKNYHGEYSLGAGHFYSFSRYVWVDQDLKRSMGY